MVDSVKAFFSYGLVLYFLMLFGCAPVDHWAVFDEPFKRQTLEEKGNPVNPPDYIQSPQIQTPLMEIFKSTGPVDLTIEQAAVLTLKNNPDLAVQQLNPAIAGTFAQIERGVYDPEVFAELTYSEEQASETSRATGEEFGVQGTDVESIAGIRQKLPSGTTLEATVEHERNMSDRAPDQQTARIGIGITQSLLRGFGPAVNLVSVRQAEMDFGASIFELRGFSEALLADSETAYWQYVLAKQEIAIYENSLSVVKQQRDEIEQKIEVGLIPKTEAAAARAPGGYP